MIDPQSSGATSDDKTFLGHASAHISFALKEGAATDSRSIEVIASQLAVMRVDVPEQLRLMLDAVRFFYISGQAFTGLAIAQKARLLALEVGDTTATCDALMLAGVCAADSGGSPTAMEAYADALALTRQLDDTVREGRIWQNLGAGLMHSGLYIEASNCFERVISLASNSSTGRAALSRAYGNIALCRLNLDEFRAGLVAIERALALAEEPSDAISQINRVIFENNYTRLLLEVGDVEGARVRAILARQFASQSKSPRADFYASSAEGLTEVFSGQTEIGIARLTKTLDRHREHNVTTREVCNALVRAYEVAGKADQALIYLRQVLEQQSTTQKQNVLQHVKLHLEQLHPALEDEENVIRRLTTHREVLEGRVAKLALFKAQVESVERMAVMAELRDDSTGVHPYRVGRLASLLAKENGCDEETVFMIDVAARLHDIGKIGISDSIVSKCGSLNVAEREIMKAHTQVGFDLLQQSQLPNVQMAVDIARHHHDWWNGSGNSPAIGEDIPLAARIVALADVYDSLTHARPYKQAWPYDDAIAAIKERRGIQFDPTLTDRFIELMERLVGEHDDLNAYLGSAAKDSTFLQARSAIANLLVR